MSDFQAVVLAMAIIMCSMVFSLSSTKAEKEKTKQIQASVELAKLNCRKEK